MFCPEQSMNSNTNCEIWCHFREYSLQKTFCIVCGKLLCRALLLMDIDSHQPCQNLETCYPPCFTEKIIYLDVFQRALLMRSALQSSKKWCTNPSCTTADDLCQENATSETASKCDDSSLPFLRAQHLKPMTVRASCDVRLPFWIFFFSFLNKSAQIAPKWRHHPKWGG